MQTDPSSALAQKRDVAQPTIVLAGAAGRALVRDGAAAGVRDRLAGRGATLAPADMADTASVAAACVASVLNGLHEVIVGRQGVLQRLLRLIDTLGGRAPTIRPAFAVRDQYVARVLDLFDWLACAHRLVHG